MTSDLAIVQLPPYPRRYPSTLAIWVVVLMTFLTAFNVSRLMHEQIRLLDMLGQLATVTNQLANATRQMAEGQHQVAETLGNLILVDNAQSATMGSLLTIEEANRKILLRIERAQRLCVLNPNGGGAIALREVR